MPSLQIRELPDELYQRLVLRARRAHRSLAQQASSDLQSAAGADTRLQRLELLERIGQEAAGNPQIIDPPEALIRADRER